MAPETAIGYRFLAWHHWSLAKRGKSPQESLAKAFNLARKALDMDESDSASHAAMGQIYLMMRKYEEAIAEGERSVELVPNGAFAISLLGMTLSYADRPDEAIGQLSLAIRLNPFAPYWYFMRLGQSYMQKGEYEKALNEYQNALQRAPQAWGVHVHLASLYVLLDRKEEAHASFKRILEQFPNFSVKPLAKATPFKNKTFHKLFFDALKKVELEVK